MIKLKILSIGKTKESWLEEAIAEYLKRLSAVISIEFIFAKDQTHLELLLEKENYIICLDAAGKLMNSEEFAVFLNDQWIKSKSRLTLVIGGADGLPAKIKEKYPLLSLSRMTFTHQITRLILIEQIYRAHEIIKGGPYSRLNFRKKSNL